MGFSIGGSKNKSSQKSNSTTNQSSTSMPIVPGYIQGPMQDYYGMVSNVMGSLFGGGSGTTPATGYQPTAGAAAAQAAANGSTVNPSQYYVGGQPAQSNFSQYGAQNPDVRAEAARVVGKDPRFPNEEAFYQWHYNNYGQKEGRQINAQTPATNAPQNSGIVPASAGGSPVPAGAQSAIPTNAEGFASKAADPAVQAAQASGNTGNGLFSITNQQPATMQADGKIIPGASPQQQKAYEDALKLGGNQSFFNTGAALGLTGAGATTYGNASSIAPTSNVSVTEVNNVAKVDPIKLAAAQLWGGTTADPAMLANAVNIGNAAQAGNTNVDAAKLAEAQSVLTNLNQYMNPYTNDVVNTTLAAADQKAAADKAQMAAQAARSGAFGGSRYGLATSNFDAQSNMNRAQTEAALRNQAFNTGAALSGQDADRRQAVSVSNSAAENARSALQAQLNQETNLSNTGWQNTFKQFQGQLDQDRNIFNATAQNDRSALNANLAQQTGLFNTGAINDRTWQQGQMDWNVGSQNAGATNNKYQADAEMAAAKAQADAAAANARAMQEASLSQQMTIANMQQAEAEKNRQLAAAALFGQFGTASGDSARADINTNLAVGQDNRAVRFDQNTEELQKLAAIQGLLGVNPGDLFGSQNTGTSNTTGTQKGTSMGVSAGYSG